MKIKAPPEHSPIVQNIPFLKFGAFAAILFGIKLWLIRTYGNATPYWDQWDAEAAKLYVPFLDGTLGWSDLFSLHNEHRIFTTRVLDLGLLTINGIWNPLLQMVVNAVLHIMTLIFIIALLCRVIGQKYLPVLLVFSLFLFGIPFAAENTLAGFQAQFYFVTLFSVACLWFTITPQPLSLRWWGGMLCAILAYLSLASGILAFAASALIAFVFYATGLRKSRQQLLAVAIPGGLFIVGWALTPTMARHAYLKATSMSQFLDALTAILGWPVPVIYLSALIVNAPNLIFTGLMLWKRPPVNDRKWFLLALVAWTFGQAASIAYGRAIGNLSSRYLDFFSVGILVNFACLIAVTQDSLHKFHNRKIDSVTTWVLVILFSLGSYACEIIPDQLRDKRDVGLIEETNTKNYLATGDVTYLKDKPIFDIPYSNWKRYASILAMPNVQAILPANIKPPLVATSVISQPLGAFVVDGISSKTPKRTDSSLGSYGTQGAKATGQASIRFNATRSDLLAIPVAGYPLTGGNKIEIIQNGQRHPVMMPSNPEDSWGIAYVDIEKGAFSIDLSNPNSAWFAVGAPYVVGRFDAFTKLLLDNFIIFILLGLGLGIAVLTQYSLVSQTNNGNTEANH